MEPCEEKVVLEVRNLICGYGAKVVLRGIDFKLRKGELLGIIGPNGSGKTTLIRVISKIIKPMDGMILFEGRDINEVSYKELARGISVVSQTQEMDRMVVEDYVLLGRIPHRRKLQFFENVEEIEISRRWMKLTGVFRFKENLLSELSGGQRQLVHLARALTQEPRLLLLDEPTAHLDITHQVTILDLIRKLNNDFGLTVIMVLHDLNLASEYCQRLILINDGKIHMDGFPEDVLTYKIVEEVYKTIVVVEKNPITGRPYVFLVPDVKQKTTERR